MSNSVTANIIWKVKCIHPIKLRYSHKNSLEHSLQKTCMKQEFAVLFCPKMAFPQNGWKLIQGSFACTKIVIKCERKHRMLFASVHVQHTSRTMRICLYLGALLRAMHEHCSSPHKQLQLCMCTRVEKQVLIYSQLTFWLQIPRNTFV